MDGETFWLVYTIMILRKFLFSPRRAEGGKSTGKFASFLVEGCFVWQMKNYRGIRAYFR
jgi:hypothetical protein